MNLANTKVVTRLSLGFAVVLFFLVAIVAVSINRMQAINTQMSSITDVNNVEVQHLSAMRAALYEQSLLIRNIALATDAAAMSKLGERMKDQLALYLDAERKLDQMFSTLAETTEPEKQAIGIIKSQSSEAGPMLAKVVELALTGRSDEIKVILASTLPALQAKRRATLADLAQFEDKLNNEANLEAKAVYHSALSAMLLLGGVAVVISIIAAATITRSLLNQLGGEPSYAALLAHKIAAGDLTQQVMTDSKNQASLMMAMKVMSDGLQQIVKQVRSGTDAILTASGQIATGNLDLSARTEEQAGSLEETASAMEQLTSTVKQNADNAKQANQLAASASDVAKRGGTLVRDVVKTMDAIEQSSKKIVDIISVIDGIAFQTNILALNAAVEAARAGEQGRGFAVVASEVRGLAQRSAAAAKEIKQLIDDSVEKVDSGGKLVAQAGETMNEVVASINGVAHVMAEMTGSSFEQSTGIEEINHALTQMDQVTQQNAALVEQAAAAAQSLQEQARTLTEVVSIFVIGSTDHAASFGTSPSYSRQ